MIFEIKLIPDELDNQREAMWAQLEPETVYDNKTSQLHVQLTCGGDVITGPPPVYVEWTVSISNEEQIIYFTLNLQYFPSYCPLI